MFLGPRSWNELDPDHNTHDDTQTHQGLQLTLKDPRFSSRLSPLNQNFDHTSPMSSDGHHTGCTIITPVVPSRVAVMRDGGCAYISPDDLPLSCCSRPLTGTFGGIFLPVNLWRRQMDFFPLSDLMWEL